MQLIRLKLVNMRVFFEGSITDDLLIKLIRRRFDQVSLINLDNGSTIMIKTFIIIQFQIKYIYIWKLNKAKTKQNKNITLSEESVQDYTYSAIVRPSVTVVQINVHTCW